MSKIDYRMELVYNTQLYNSRPVVQLLMVAKVYDFYAYLMHLFIILNNLARFLSKLESEPVQCGHLN